MALLETRRRKRIREGEKGGEEGEAAAATCAASPVTAQFNIQIRKSKHHFFPGAPFSVLLKCLLDKIWDELHTNSAVTKLGMGREGGGEKQLTFRGSKNHGFFLSFFFFAEGWGGGRKDLTSSIRKSRDGEDYRLALQIFCIS